MNRNDRGSSYRGGGRSDRGAGRSERPTMHSTVCDECGQRCEVPFKPTENKPVFCSRCFENVDPKRRPSSSSNTEKKSVDISPITEQLSVLNSKLDVLIDVLTPKKVVKKKK